MAVAPVHLGLDLCQAPRDSERAAEAASLTASQTAGLPGRELHQLTNTLSPAACAAWAAG